MPGEFWDEAIREVKKTNPNFKFIAEAYWDKEDHLGRLGFDLCYEKKLYDALVARDLGRVLERLQRDSDALRASLYFIENHDEPRAASVFDRPANLAALALILSVPGSVLIHEGQMEGKRERLPVQRIRPLTDEPVDLSLKESYAQLLSVTNNEIFMNGDFRLFEPGVYGAIGFTRSNNHRVVAYIAQISEAWHRFNAPPMNVSAIAYEVGASSQMRLTNLLNSTSTTVQPGDGAFYLEMSRLGIDDETKFCLLEASPA
jgi:glycosidase